jgi:predicted nicotinamide N-methyase
MKLEIQQFVFADKSIELFVPNSIDVQNNYQSAKQIDEATPFPYWAKVWHSSVAMCFFLSRNTQLIQNKSVVEIAAGLGLPSLFTALFAKQVICSDYLQEPLNIVEQSILQNALTNVQCRIINWNQPPQNLTTDVLLLSDINYEPTAFASLFKLLQQFLQQGTTIILTTPQRLMAKIFIEQLLPYCILQETEIIEENTISILVLKSDNLK